ncbi:MAG: tetratricopeptide repeat protein [Candidatus Hodarchaeales archaeon]
MSIIEESDKTTINKILLQSEYLFAIGDKHSAYKSLEEILTFYIKTQYLGRIKACYGELLIRDSRLFEAETILRESLHLCRLQEDINGQIKSLFSLSYLESRFGQHLEGLELVREGLDLAHSNHHELLALGYYHQARVYWALGDLNIAFKYCTLAIGYTTIITEDHFTIIRVKNLMGVIKRAQGDLSGALDNLSDALQIVYDHYLIDNLPLIFNNIGHVYNNLGKLSKAEYYLQKCIIISEDIDNIGWLGSAYAELADNYAVRGFYKEAHEYFEKALAVNMSLGISLWYDFSRMAVLERNFGHYQESLTYFSKALEEMERTGEKRFFAEINANYARVLVLLDEREKAQKLIEISEEYVKQQGKITPPLLVLTKGIIELTVEGDHEKTRSYFLRAFSLAKEQERVQDIVETSLYLIRSFLTQYSETNTEHYFLLAQKYVDETLTLAKESHLYPQTINIELLAGGLQIAKYNYGKAIKIIMDSIKIAQELGFNREVDDGRRFLQQIQRAIQRMGDIPVGVGIDSRSPSYQYQTGALMSYINRLTNLDTRKDIIPDDLLFLVFKFGELGPEPFYMKPDPDIYGQGIIGVEFILNLGVLLSFLIGQQYFTGLYGPLPIQYLPEASTLIFTSRIGNSQSPDERLTEGNYVIFCTLYPMTLDHTFIGRGELKQLFSNFCLTNPDLTKWTEADLDNLREKVVFLILKSNV